MWCDIAIRSALIYLQKADKTLTYSFVFNSNKTIAIACNSELKCI